MDSPSVLPTLPYPKPSQPNPTRQTHQLTASQQLAELTSQTNYILKAQPASQPASHHHSLTHTQRTYL
ncbi:hypothetical protein BO82DRAFT_350190 [Aspergillus uvarum CBS 121591]|uniref:Uncharacterized protein n=1 Tax=Aspergillus uvarum CBS 121591 TaxID=1448315 RepID=A0A319DEG6_9EURO|nr:hypothetical protein BO82DRAFT_350190 [Aspergillus uvarum CBS 121591]PYH86488.1 hypothetical protein BO82DRAFT_350190 [Aspergillus uvarum CBS 121591]